MKIEVHSKTACPFCVLAKKYLNEHAVTFDEVVYDDDDARAEMYERFELVGNQRTVPQIFVVENDGTRQRVGGYTDLIQSDVVARASIGFQADVEF